MANIPQIPVHSWENQPIRLALISMACLSYPMAASVAIATISPETDIVFLRHTRTLAQHVPILAVQLAVFYVCYKYAPALVAYLRSLIRPSLKCSMHGLALGVILLPAMYLVRNAFWLWAGASTGDSDALYFTGGSGRGERQYGPLMLALALVIFVVDCGMLICNSIYEECFLLGPLTALANMGPRAYASGAILSALVRLVAHAYQGAIMLPGVFLFGLCGSVVIYRGGNIYTFIVAHAAYNATILLLNAIRVLA